MKNKSKNIDRKLYTAYCRKMQKNIRRLKDFDKAVKPAIKWLAENGHPHMKIIIENNSAELVEGQKTFLTDKYLLD